LVEQQKIDIEEETTAKSSLTRGIKKETKHEQRPSKSGEMEEQDNAAGAETEDLNNQR
jgi:hypothetical protein